MAHGFLNGSNYDNYNLGYNDGKQAEYDAFWDAVYATYNPDGKCNFAGSAWNDTTFNPKETLQPLIADSMFRECRVTNLKGIFERNVCQYRLYCPIVDCRTSLPLLHIATTLWI